MPPHLSPDDDDRKSVGENVKHKRPTTSQRPQTLGPLPATYCMIHAVSSRREVLVLAMFVISYSCCVHHWWSSPDPTVVWTSRVNVAKVMHLRTRMHWCVHCLNMNNHTQQLKYSSAFFTKLQSTCVLVFGSPSLCCRSEDASECNIF